MSGGGSSGGSSQVVQQTQPNSAFVTAYQNLLKQAQGVASAPLEQTPAGPNSSNYVAPLSGQQQQATGIVQNAQGIAAPYLNTAAQYMSKANTPLWSGVQQWSPGAVQQYESPYTDQVVDATQKDFANLNAQQQQQLIGNAISSGAWGGDRSAVAQSILAGQQTANEAPILANLRNTGYQTATQEFNTQQQAELGANEANAWLNSQTGYGFANLGNEALSTTLSGASALLGVGGLQQNQIQQELNIPLELQQARQAYPFQTTGWLSGIAEGTGAASGSTGTTTQSYNPDLASEIVGGASSALGIAGLTGGFGNNGWLYSNAGSSGLLNGIFARDGGAIPTRYRGGVVVPFHRERRDSGGGVSIPFLDPSIYQAMVQPVNLNIDQTAGAPGTPVLASTAPSSIPTQSGSVWTPNPAGGTQAGGVNGGGSGQPGVTANPSQGAQFGDPNNTFGQIGFATLAAMSPFGTLTSLAHLAGVPVPTMMGIIGHAINGPDIGGEDANTASGSNVGGGAANSAGDNGPGIGGHDSGTSSGSNVGGGAANSTAGHGGVSSGPGGVSAGGGPASGGIGSPTGGAGQGGVGAGAGVGAWRKGGYVTGIMAGVNDNDYPHRHRATGTHGFADGGTPSVTMMTGADGVDIPQLNWSAAPTSLDTTTQPTPAITTPSQAPIITPSPIPAPTPSAPAPSPSPVRPSGSSSGAWTPPGYWIGNGFRPTDNTTSIMEATAQHAGPNGQSHRARGGILGRDVGGDIDPIEPVTQTQMLGDTPIPQAPDQYAADLLYHPQQTGIAATAQPLQPSGGIAATISRQPARWTPDYNPSAPIDRSTDIRQMAPWLALTLGGARTLAGHGTFAQNIGEGLSAGLETYVGQEQEARQAEQQAQQIGDQQSYRKNTLQADAQRLADAAEEARKRAAQTDVAQTETHRHNVAEEGFRSQQLETESVPPDVRTAKWLATASDADKQAYYEAQGLKAGLPPGMLGLNGNAPATGEDALAKLPPGEQAIVKSMIEGRMAPPSSFALKDKTWQMRMAIANQVDPTFDQTTWMSRNATRRDFTAGSSAKNLTAINTALGHAAVLQDAFDKLDNGSLPTWNAAANWLAKQTGDPRPTSTQEAVNALASESRKVFAATGGGGLTELKEWQDAFPINGSPAQQKAALTQLVRLYDSRIEALGDQYSRGMGRSEDGINLLSPEAKSAYEKLTGSEPKSDKVLGSKGQAAPAKDQNPSAPAKEIPTTPQFYIPDNLKGLADKGLAYNAARQQFRDGEGNIYDIKGQLVTAARSPGETFQLKNPVEITPGSPMTLVRP